MKTGREKAKGFAWAKKLALMGRTKEAKQIIAEAICCWENRLLHSSRANPETHIKLFEAYYFVGEKEQARKHLHAYIEKEKRSIASHLKTADRPFLGARFRIGYLKGKETWLHYLAMGCLGRYFQDIHDRPAIWAFDVDGTLVDINGYSWDMIDESLGVQKSAQDLTKRYRKRKISSEKWMELTLRLYKSFGLTKERFDSIFATVELSEGAFETIAALKQADRKTAIISGGFENVLDGKIPLELFDERHINRLHFGRDGTLLDWEITPYGDGKAKAKPVRNLIKQAGKSKKRFLAYVGDNENDLEAFATADLAITYNPKTTKVREAADLVIEGDMRQILSCL